MLMAASDSEGAAGRQRDRDSSSGSMGAFQEYLDEKFSSLKRELREDLLVSNDKQLKKLRENSRARDFKWTSNRKQFEFNSEVIEDLDSASGLIRNGEQYKSLDKLSEISKKLNRRNKLIKLADKSPAGWDTVAEYESDEIASDSDDDKKIRRAEKRALERKKFRSNPKPSSISPAFLDRYKGVDSKVDFTDQPYRGVLSNFRAPRRNNRPLTQCFGCGGFGHIRSGCPRMLRAQAPGYYPVLGSIFPAQDLSARVEQQQTIVNKQQQAATEPKQVV